MKSTSKKHYIPYNFLVINVILLLPLADAAKEYSSYRRYPLCQPSEDIRYPASVDDIVKIVKEAISKKLTVKAFGVRHSQTDIICTEGIPVDMTRIQSMKMNADYTATFGAGLNLREATTFMRLHNRALRTTPAYGNITIGGAIGTGAHGSSIKYNASISSQIAKLKIVDGKGVIRDITDPEDLKAFRMHLGLLGIVVEVTLNTVQLYKTLAQNYVVSDEILTNDKAVSMAKNTDQISLYWFPEFKEVVVANWTIVDKATPGTDYTNDHVPSTYSNFALVSSIAKEIAFTLTESKCASASTLGYTILHAFEYFLELALYVPVPDWVPIYATQQGYFKNPSVGYYDEMFAPICYDEPQGILGTACVWSHGSNSLTILDNEFSLELSRLGKFIEAVKKIVKETPTAFPLQAILMRFSDQSDIYMSTSYGRQSVHFEFYLWNRDDIYERASGSLAGYQTILQTLTKEFNGRSHWGKSGMVYHSRDMIDLKLNEGARQKFVAVMNKYDPDEVFINNFGRRIKRTGSKIDIDPLTKHCALLDNCFCSTDSDCSSTQICTKLPGYFYNVCKTKNEVAPVAFDKSLFPVPFGILSYLVSDVPTLVKSVIANCTLKDPLGTIGSIVPSVIPVDKTLETIGELSDKLGELNLLHDVVGGLGGVVGGDFVKAVKKIVKKTPTAFPLQAILMRFSDKSDIYMSPSYGRQSVHFEFYLWNRDDIYGHASGSLAGYQTILQTLTKEFNGRSHWGKSGMVYHSRDMLDLKLDEEARQNFIAVMNKYDPDEVFINNFGRRIKRNGDKIDIDPLTKHCALLDNCFCSTDSDCSPTQTCTKLQGYVYNVCKTKNEVAPVAFDRSLFRPPFGILSYLVSDVPTLVRSVIANCTLTNPVGVLGSLLPGRADNVLQTAATLSAKLGGLKLLGGVVGTVGDVVGGILRKSND